MATKKRPPAKAKARAKKLPRVTVGEMVRVALPSVSVPPVPPKRSLFATCWAWLRGKP